ncbi:hypothetical protein GCM10027456_83190 [Kineosporia babensis]
MGRRERGWPAAAARLARAPSEATFRRVITSTDADQLDALLGVFFHTRTASLGGRRVIAMDGKSVRVRHEVACIEWITLQEVPLW